MYKLFNLICKETPDQILRYLPPHLYRQLQVSPLWASPKNTMEADKVPVCQNCGKARQFELQIMP